MEPLLAAIIAQDKEIVKMFLDAGAAPGKRRKTR